MEKNIEIKLNYKKKSFTEKNGREENHIRCSALDSIRINSIRSINQSIKMDDLHREGPIFIQKKNRMETKIVVDLLKRNLCQLMIIFGWLVVVDDDDDGNHI